MPKSPQSISVWAGTRNHPLANTLKQIEAEYRTGNAADVAAGLVQAIRSRYEFVDPEAVQLESQPKLK